MKKIKVVVLAGPTASGKTECAVRLAQNTGGEIISADSMQIYKYMDIGSAKPTAEERAAAVHHMIDEIDPADDFSAAKYRELAGKYIRRVHDEGKVPIVEGGTGLYVNSIVSDMDFSSTSSNPALREELRLEAEKYGGGYLHDRLAAVDPAAAERIHPNNVKKMIRAIEAAEAGKPIPSFSNAAAGTGEYDCLMFGITRDRQLLYDRINKRVDIMIEDGLVNEVKEILGRGISSDSIAMKGIGYKEIIGYLDGRYSFDEAVELVKRNTRRYAKRQLTWFRRYKDMIWYDVTYCIDDAVCDMTGRVLNFIK